MNTYARIDDDLRSTWAFSDIARVARLFWRHVIFLATAALVGLSVMIVTMVMSGPSYEVSAKLLVRLGREMLAPTIVDAKDAGQAQPLMKRPEDLASEVEIFTDPRLIQQAVDYFGSDFFLAEDPPRTVFQRVKRMMKTLRAWLNDLSREALILAGLRQEITPLDRVTLAIAQGLEVEAVRKSDVIEIRLHFPDPKVGELFLNRFIALGIESHVAAYKTVGEREFFQNEREKQGIELQQAENHLLDARSNHDAIYSGAEQFANLLKAQADTQQQLDAAAADVADTRAEIDYARQALKTIPPEITLSTMLSRQRSGDDAAAQLNLLLVDLAKLRATYADQAPEVRDLLGQIATLREIQAAQSQLRVEGTSTGPNLQYTQLARDLTVKEGLLRGQSARVTALTLQTIRLRDQARSAQRIEIEIAQIGRRIAQLRHSIDVYDKALEEARLAENMDALALSNLKVIMPATSELVPSSPSIGRSLIMGVAGGLTMAIGFILVRDWRQRMACDGMA